MNKTRIVLLSWIVCLFISLSSFALPTANVQMRYANDTLTITNQSKQSISLRNASLHFYYAGKISAVNSVSPLKIKLQTKVKNLTQLPNNQGNFYQVDFMETNQASLSPGQHIQLKIVTDKKVPPHGFELLANALTPVQVKVTVLAPNWTQTIQVCNTSSNPIPLTNIEFDFNYNASMPSSTSIWGQPWVAWTAASQQGSQVMLVGGTQWTPPLQPDPNCANPLTIQFGSTPQSPAPTGPFTFKAEGGIPSGNGGMTISLSSAPASGLANPQITVQGASSTLQQTVVWGQQWEIKNLVPGMYTVSATPVDNGQQFYQVAPMNVTVQDQTVTPVSLSYQPVPASDVTVSFVNAPAAQEPVKFTGQHYTFSYTVSNGMTVQLPADTYSVTSAVSGYSAAISPNPLVVPNNNSVAITYQPASSARFVGYYESWSSDWQTDGSKTKLANLPGYINVVNLAFMRPDAVYHKGSMNYVGTGLEFNYENGTVLKQAIATLHQKHPETKVIVSVGGASFTNWQGFNVQAIVDFVQDFGLDGVDIDYEPSGSPGCAKGSDGHVHCQIDAAFQSYINLTRSALPRPYWVTVAAWSVGAYGEDQWVNAPPQSDLTGIMLPLFRSTAASALDMVNVMSYDAGTSYNPQQALAAYSNYYAGPISMGVEVPPEGWGGHIYTMDQVNQLAQAVMTSAPTHGTPPGMMLWSLQKVPNGTPTADNPSAQMMATAICTDLGLTNCSEVLLKNS
ncbi:MAG: hypothetical protein EPO11_09480 [Gammaproteobacteria bacterium]|nr:MAG: hypothetical protein EPO11_09480 [Gammaproteobacteria bacterium]